jgi:hypothetical protein
MAEEYFFWKLLRNIDIKKEAQIVPLLLWYEIVQ